MTESDNVLIKGTSRHHQRTTINHIQQLTDRRRIFHPDEAYRKLYPLHKANSKDETTNYRPISLLLTVSKILEKVRCTQESTDFSPMTQNNYMLANTDSRKNHACDQAVGELVAVITKGIEQKKLTAGVFLDLIKGL